MNREFNKRYKELVDKFNIGEEELKNRPLFSWNDLEEARKKADGNKWDKFLMGFSLSFIIFLTVFLITNSRH